MRAAILRLFVDAHPRHLTAPEIHTRLVRTGTPADPSGVYRSLSALVAHELIHAVSSGGNLSYGLDDPANHHTACTLCGSVEPVPGALIDTAARTIATSIGQDTSFRPSSNGVVVHGECERCTPSGVRG